MKNLKPRKSGRVTHEFVNLLRTLNKQEKLIIALYFYERLSPAQIAYVLSRDEKTIQRKINKLIIKIQNKASEFQLQELFSHASL
jgi:RNA polymerase sigma factor (sigma-70 family)